MELVPENMSVKKLKAWCKSQGISGYSGLKKKEIIKLVKSSKQKVQNDYSLVDLSNKKLVDLQNICKQMQMQYKGKKKNDLICMIVKRKTPEQQEFKATLYDLESGDEQILDSQSQCSEETT